MARGRSGSRGQNRGGFNAYAEVRRQQRAALEADQADERIRRGSTWTSGGSVDGEAAKTLQDGDRVEALWGGAHPDGDGEGHGHIVSNDGLNAASVRYPGEEQDAFNNPEDRRHR